MLAEVPSADQPDPAICGIVAAMDARPAVVGVSGNGTPGGRPDAGLFADSTRAVLATRQIDAAARAREVIETAPDAFVAIDADGTVIDWNAEAERTFGWTRDEIVGLSLADTLIPTSDDHSGGAINWLLGSNEGKTRRGTLARCRDERILAVEVTAWATGDGNDGTHGQVGNAFLRAVPDRDNSDDDRRRLAAIVDSSEEAIIGTTADGTIVTWNKGAEALFGYRLSEVVGQPVSLVVVEDEREQLAAKTEAVRRGRPLHRHDTHGLRNNGVVLDISMTMSPVCDDAGAITGLCIVARDVTEQRWMARTLNETLASLEDALVEARDSEARTRRFTADAAHQLRTPIAGIRACAETLLRMPASEDREGLLANVIRETGRAARLMTSLLQMARVDQGQVLTPTRCDVVRLCTEEAERAQDLAPNLDVSVRVENRPDRRPELDPNAVHEILSNLLDNARRHARGRIELVVATRDGQVELRVADDGPGLSDALAEQAFERFVSLDGRGGSGLGLPIARGLARIHGGDLTYEDHAFVLRLPVKANIDCGGASRPDFGPAEIAPEWESWQAP